MFKVVSLNVSEELLDFIDKQGKNRSKTVTNILKEFMIKKQQDELEKEEN